MIWTLRNAAACPTVAVSAMIERRVIVVSRSIQTFLPVGGLGSGLRAGLTSKRPRVLS